MNRRLPTLLALGALVPAWADLSEPPAQWWSPPVPHLDAVARPDLGLAGQPESSPSLADQGDAGTAYTRAFLRVAPASASDGDLDWTRRSTRFGLETVVALPGGWAMGLDAIDDQIIHRATASDSRWELAKPRGGLRIGAGVNVLESFLPESPYAWGWSVWVPLMDRTGELEVQTGFRDARRWRLDASWATRLVRQKARRSDSLLDTTTLRAGESRWSLRVGGQNARGTSGQVWGGWRRLEDVRTDDDARSTGLASAAWFFGTQGRSSWKSWDLEGEVRGDRGSDTLRTGIAGAATTASTDHLLLDGRASLDAPWTGIVRPRLEVAGAFLDLDQAVADGVFPQLPSGTTTQGGGSLLRLGGALETRVRTKWIDILPKVGLHRLRLAGDIPQVWAGLWPLPPGEAWLGELAGALAWQGSATKFRYDLGWVFPLHEARAELGLSHRLELRQGF